MKVFACETRYSFIVLNIHEWWKYFFILIFLSDIIIISLLFICRYGGTGRHVRLRGVWSNPWEFKSLYLHQYWVNRFDSDIRPFFVVGIGANSEIQRFLGSFFIYEEDFIHYLLVRHPRSLHDYKKDHYPYDVVLYMKSIVDHYFQINFYKNLIFIYIYHCD